jgi:hypothetical protein
VTLADFGYPVYVFACLFFFAVVFLLLFAPKDFICFSNFLIFSVPKGLLQKRIVHTELEDIEVVFIAANVYVVSDF